MKPLFTGEFCPRDCDRGAWDPQPCTRAGRLMEEGIFGKLPPLWYRPNIPLIANELVRVEPMELPKGLLFHMDIKRVIEENSVKVPVGKAPPFHYAHRGRKGRK